MSQESDSDLQRQFDALHRDHPPKTLEVGGITWCYTAVGQGPEGLMLFPGAVGSGDVFFALIPLLADRYRLIMITIPLVAGLEQLMQGLPGHPSAGHTGPAAASPPRDDQESDRRA